MREMTQEIRFRSICSNMIQRTGASRELWPRKVGNLWFLYLAKALIKSLFITGIITVRRYLVGNAIWYMAIFLTEKKNA